MFCFPYTGWRARPTAQPALAAGRGWPFSQLQRQEPSSRRQPSPPSVRHWPRSRRRCSPMEVLWHVVQQEWGWRWRRGRKNTGQTCRLYSSGLRVHGPERVEWEWLRKLVTYLVDEPFQDGLYNPGLAIIILVCFKGRRTMWEGTYAGIQTCITESIDQWSSAGREKRGVWGHYLQSKRWERISVGVPCKLNYQASTYRQTRPLDMMADCW